MRRHSDALALPGATTATTTNGNSKIFFEAWFKLNQISQKVEDEFQKVLLTQAQQMAAADPATFDRVAFVTGWTRETEGYNSSTKAISSLRTQLNKVIGWDARKHSDELIQAAKEKREALQADLDKRNEADTALEQQIKTLDKLIGASSGAAQAGATPAGRPGKRGRKKAAKPALGAAKGAARRAKAGKKGGKKP